MREWMEVEVGIPKALRELHGERATRGELSLVYGGGLTLALVALLLGRRSLEYFAWWKTVLVAIVALDVSGGALANLCRGTNRYWQERGLRARILFIGLHALHPFLLWLAYPGQLPVLAASWFWVAISFAIVTIIGRRAGRELPAMYLALLGICALILSRASSPLVTFLMVAFQLKLVLGFCPDRR